MWQEIPGARYDRVCFFSMRRSQAEVEDNKAKRLLLFWVVEGNWD